MTEVQISTCLIDKFISAYPEYRDNAWDYRNVQDTFKFNYFAAGFSFVTRINDGVTGSLQFMEFEGSRVYFNFRTN